jgi:SAM-dependent methyltransferase
MPAEGNIYESDRLAFGYAHHRPPVHAEIIKIVRERLRITERKRRALDIGCGAGLSTAALAPLADGLFGIEPILPMLKYRKAVTSSAHFAVARAEQLPFADRAFDLLTAAGALNYADLDLFLPEAKRVLGEAGKLLIYDFSEGRRMLNDTRLDDWYATFRARFPAPPGYALDVKALPFEQHGLRLEMFEDLEVVLPMTFEAYVLYALSETRVELALQAGQTEAGIRAWCEQTLQPIFADQTLEVYFDAYTAYVGHSDCGEL